MKYLKKLRDWWAYYWQVLPSPRPEKTYQLGETDAVAWILCTKCGAKSFNPTDVSEKYCGRCKEFHNEPPREE